MQSKSRKISAVIFDIDGTLVDSFSAYYSIFNRGISRYNLGPASRKFLANCLKESLSLGEMLRRIFSTNGGEPLIERCKREILELFLKVEVDEVKPYPGINELLENLKDRGIKIGIATGRMSLPEDEWSRFKRFGLDRFIDAIVTSREVEGRKPAPDTIIECAKRLNVLIEECLVVGDTGSDIVAARRAGAIPVAVSRGQDNKDLLEKEKPESIFKNLNELITYLEEQEINGRDL